MTQANYKPWFKTLMNLYVGFIMRWDFKRVVFQPLPNISPEKSVLVLGNHFSWWDPFLIAYAFIPTRKRHHVMMLETELAKRRALAWAGAFGIDRTNRKDMLSSIQYTRLLLQNPSHMVTIFPTGKIESQHGVSPVFQSGLAYILGNPMPKVEVIFAVGLSDYFSYRKPTMYYYFKSYSWDGTFEIENCQKAFLEFYSECVNTQKSLSN